MTINDIGKLRVFTGYIDHNPVDDQILSDLHNILENFKQHEEDFDMVFNRINEFMVPLDGEEEIPQLVYSDRIVMPV